MSNEIIIDLDNRNEEIEIGSDIKTVTVSNYELLSNKPQINSVELSGNKTLNELGIQAKEDGKGLSTNDFTNEYKNQLDNLDVPTKTSDLVNDSGFISTETDPTVPNHVKNITQQDIIDWENKSDFSGDYNDLTSKPTIPDVSNFITKDVDNLTNYELKTNTGTSLELSINSSTYVMTLKLKNSSGTILSTQEVDLPLESVVVGGSYDSVNKKVILTLQNGSTVEFSVADLVSGLQAEITSTNKLNADLVDDTNSTNKFFSGNYEDLTNKPTIPDVNTLQPKITSTNQLSSDLVDDTNKENKFMTAEEKQKLNSIEDNAEENVIDTITVNNEEIIPVNKTVALNIMTNTVNNLVNYYLKTETYTKTEVDSLISAIVTLNIVAVETLPTENISRTTIYLVPKAEAQVQNIKDEYINITGDSTGWEKIGDTQIDLSNYVTNTELNTILASYVTSTDLTTALANKIDKVSNPVSGNFASLDSNGNITDSGKSPTDINNIYSSMANNGVKNFVKFDDTSSTTTQGITYTYNDDGSITLNGTATRQSYIFPCNSSNGFKLEANRTFILTGVPANSRSIIKSEIC